MTALHADVFKPERIGNLYGHSKSSVFGFCSDHAGILVALSVQASNTTIEQLHMKLQRQEDSISLQTDYQVEGFSTRSGYSRKDHFTVVKTAIPDTNEISMIMINDSMFKPIKDASFTHVWYRNDEDFKRELFYRVREIVYIPVLEKWSSYLYMKGMTTAPGYRRNPMCGVFTKRPAKSWLTAGFSIGYVMNSREEWETLITAGLKTGAIEI